MTSKTQTRLLLSAALVAFILTFMTALRADPHPSDPGGPEAISCIK